MAFCCLWCCRALRALRNARGLTVKRVAERVARSPSKVSRMETGQRGATQRDRRSRPRRPQLDRWPQGGCPGIDPASLPWWAGNIRARRWRSSSVDGVGELAVPVADHEFEPTDPSPKSISRLRACWAVQAPLG